MSFSAGIASQTKLPPSPEMKAAATAAMPAPLDLFSLDGPSEQQKQQQKQQQPRRRLCSISSYESFQPHALAAGSPLGAVAGSQGVALFHLSQPQSPLMMLSYAFHQHRSSFSVTPTLSFQPRDNSKNDQHHHHHQQHLWLASTRGSGVLVWDMSGHSLSPLWGRLDGGGGDLVDLGWPKSPLLAATTTSAASLWDLRQRPAPVLRFGARQRSGSEPYVQIACNAEQECALLDATGTLRVFDTRMTERSRTSLGAVSSFPALYHAGVGLASLRTSSDEKAWVAWGLDEPGNDAVVKVWGAKSSKAAAATANSEKTSPTSKDVGDDYWSMDPSLATVRSSTRASYQLIGSCSTDNLACARVCPAPCQDEIVTVGLESNPDGTPSTSWRATLWKLNSNGSRKMDRVTSFVGGQDIEQRFEDMMVGMKVGFLRAAELAIVSSPSCFSLSTETSARKTEGQTLLVCALTEKGFVSTHALPEALPDQPKEEEIMLKPLSPTSERRKFGLDGSAPRLFPSEREAAMSDAARVWNRSGSIERSETRSEPGEMIEAHGIPPPGEGTASFDVIETPSAPYAGILATQAAGPSVVAGSPSVLVTTENDQSPSHHADAVALMNKIETDRIPCPRLCGATFSPGVGGLAVFRNGDVRKVWEWWASSHPARLSTVPGLIGEPAPNAVASGKAVSTETSSSSGEGAPDAAIKKPALREFPRTLKDVTDMTTAARAAQWGDQDESDVSSAGIQALGDNFFEEDSDASSDSGEDQADDFLAGEKDPKDIYSQYFGASRDLLAVPSLSTEEVSRGEQEDGEDRVQEGTPSDILAPVVKVSHEYDTMALNSQSAELAEGWELGDVDAIEGTLKKESTPLLTRAATSDPSLRREMPDYRSPPRQQHPKSSWSKPSARLAYSTDDEQGVHGGEYSVRPNVQESMVFLRKLFTHQKDGAESVSKLISPPEGPLLSKGLAQAGFRPKKGHTVLSRRRENIAVSGGQKLGVYALRKVPAASQVSKGLEKMKYNCLHNRDVCQALGEQEKGKVWSLLAQLVDMRLNENRSSFDGWGGFGGAAFGMSMVENLLRYYESLGDVQMLSTIVCVLRDSRRQQVGTPHFMLLPSGQDEKYDLYIQRYADLLYGWGLLTVRSEVLKYLVRHSASTEVTPWVPGQSEDVAVSIPAVGLLFSCPRCGGNTEPGTNYCRSCQDYAFRCAICDNAIRGLFTVCKSCGHGGHMNHLQEWFSKRVLCPTGCGCKCTFEDTKGLSSTDKIEVS